MIVGFFYNGALILLGKSLITNGLTSWRVGCKVDVTLTSLALRSAELNPQSRQLPNGGAL